jgi:hypothetical protein
VVAILENDRFLQLIQDDRRRTPTHHATRRSGFESGPALKNNHHGTPTPLHHPVPHHGCHQGHLGCVE